MDKEKQIEEMDLAVLNCFRNKYYTDGNSTENGIISNAINNVLPILIKLNNGRAVYRKQIDVAKEIFEEIDNIIYNLRDSPFYSSSDAVYELTELKKKYTEESGNGR